MAKIEGYEAFAMNWTETERGMGQRSDGFSLHLSKPDAEQYKLEHGIEGNSEEYSFPESSIFRVIVDEATHQALQELKEKGVAGFRRAFPKDLEAGQIVPLR